MKQYLWIVICCSLFPLASCGDEDDFVKPRLETGEPLARAADLPDSLDLMSNAPNARDAQGWTHELFLAVWREAGMAHAVLYPSRSLPWSRIDGGCWRCSYGYGADTLSRGVYLACPTARGHRWRLDHRQWCAPGAECGYRPIARGTTGAAGTTGAFSAVSRSDSTRVTFSWEWIASADADSIRWTFYRGGIGPGALGATMDWSEREDGTRTWVWEWPADERWEMQVASDPTTGWLKDYLWSASAGTWRIAHIFNWSGGHGTWDQFDASGRVVESLNW